MGKMFLVFLSIFSLQATQNMRKNNYVRKELHAYIKEQNRKVENYSQLNNQKRNSTKKRVRQCVTAHLPLIAIAATSLWIVAALNHAPREKVKIY